MNHYGIDLDVFADTWWDAMLCVQDGRDRHNIMIEGNSLEEAAQTLSMRLTHYLKSLMYIADEDGNLAKMQKYTVLYTGTRDGLRINAMNENNAAFIANEKRPGKPFRITRIIEMDIS